MFSRENTSHPLFSTCLCSLLIIAQEQCIIRRMVSVQSCEDKAVWDEEVLSHGGHPLQLWGWGEVKAAHNWHVDRVRVMEGEDFLGLAQLLIRPLPAPFKALVYVPRGPVAEEAVRRQVLDALAEYAKGKYGAVAVTVEPDWVTMPDLEGWRRSDNTILIPRTLILDLHKSEDELMNAMTKKTRQYIRKSEKEGIV